MLTRVTATGSLIRCWWEREMAQLLWGTVRQFLTKLNTVWARDQAITLLHRYRMAGRLRPHKSLHMNGYSSLICNCPNWKQPRRPSTGESINKWWDIKTIKYDSEITSYQATKTWRKLKCVLLSERGQSEKATYCRSPTLWQSGERQEKDQWIRKDKQVALRIFRAMKLCQ